MRTALNILLTSFLLIPSIFVFSQEGEDAASASATGSAAAPAKGAPKAAQANSKLRVLHIAVHKHGIRIEDIKKMISNGTSLATFSQNYKEIAEQGGDFAKHGHLVVKGHSVSDSVIYGDYLNAHYNDPDKVGQVFTLKEILDTAKESHNDEVGDPSLLINDAKSLVLQRYGDSYDSSNSQFTSALNIATTLLTDRTITSTDTLPSNIITGNSISGYTLAFARILSAYGAFGANGENLATTVLGANYSGYSSDSALSTLSSSSDYLKFLSALTGSYDTSNTLTEGRTFEDENFGSTVLSVPMGNVMLAGGSTINLGQSSADSEISVNPTLSSTKATSASGRQVLVIGAAKDLNVEGNVKLTNTNNVEDHALVLGAADDVMISGTADSPINIEYTGSNLGIGSGDTGASSMYLVNTNIKTGGNLAAGSLGTMNISDAGFSVGLANSTTSDPDNVYLYANELININNLAFSGRVDDIYMESKTIHIQNTSFPPTADVMLRSQAGSLHFPTSAANVATGGVNFTNVKHLGISSSDLTSSQFSGVNGHINSTATLPNGTPFIKIRGQ
tara:strand:+ start:1041 stop:2729 length:1689 start_codon:yes stop_codon:yes gene_type:complete